MLPNKYAVVRCWPRCRNTSSRRVDPQGRPLAVKAGISLPIDDRRTAFFCDTSRHAKRSRSRTNISQTVTERPNLAQFPAQVTIVTPSAKRPEKKPFPAKPCPTSATDKSQVLLSGDPRSWPLDCICLYVQVNVCAYKLPARSCATPVYARGQGQKPADDHGLIDRSGAHGEGTAIQAETIMGANQPA